MVAGKDTRCVEGLTRRQTLKVGDESFDLIVNRGVLPAGTDGFLAFPPETFHGIEFRRTVRQPDQLDRQGRRQLQGTAGGVTGIFIQQQRQGPPSVLPMQEMQELLEIGGPSIPTGKEPSSAGAQIHRPEDHTTGVVSRDPDVTRPPPQRPAGLQGRKQQ